ncbi:hypothetical protein GCM10023328_05240 [Modestobacter marinus]|nr:hypothetical protein GCM10011589_04720 [Modestobacter marinus]
MTETYLQVETADDPEYAEFGSPSLRDRLDVARLAVRLRLGAPGASVRAVATGRTVRLVAVAGTVTLASMALVGLVSTAWLHGVIPLVDAPDLGGTPLWGPRDAVSTVVSALTVALGVCAVRGLAATRPLAVAVLAGHVVEVASAEVAFPGPVGPGPLLTGFTLAVPLVAAALAPAGPPVRRPWWPCWLGVVVLAPWAVGLTALTRAPAEPAGWLLALADPFVHLGTVLVLTGAALLGRRRPARGPAELAVAVLAAALVPTLAGRLAYAVPTGWSTTVLAVTLGVVGTSVVAGAVGLRAVRALPATVPADR